MFRSRFVSTFVLALTRRLVPVSKSYHRRRPGELVSTQHKERLCPQAQAKTHWNTVFLFDYLAVGLI